MVRIPPRWMLSVSRINFRALSLLAVALSLVALFTACDEPSGEWTPPPDKEYRFDDLPEGVPEPPEVEGEPLTWPRVELGRHLFYDLRLSLNETQSCASCHQQERAFTDGLATSIGSTGEVHFRNSQSLVNVAYVPRFTWSNPLLDSLSRQALIPLLGERPIELGAGGHEDKILERLAGDERYQQLFPLAFPEEEEPLSIHSIAVALAAFQRTIVSFRSRYDRYIYEKDESALTAEELHGMQLFFSERTECFHCHAGVLFSDAVDHQGLAFVELPFHNNGLYNIDGEGGYPLRDRGVFDVTGKPQDMGRFRSPSLRNVALTAPYFHDGSAETLEEVLEHYMRGGRLIEEGPNAGDGALSPHKNAFIREFLLLEHEKQAMIAFLEALTDEPLLSDPRFANPWPEDYFSAE